MEFLPPRRYPAQPVKVLHNLLTAMKHISKKVRMVSQIEKMGQPQIHYTHAQARAQDQGKQSLYDLASLGKQRQVKNRPYSGCNEQEGLDRIVPQVRKHHLNEHPKAQTCDDHLKCLHEKILP
jgi:hypothetical protein